MIEKEISFVFRAGKLGEGKTTEWIQSLGYGDICRLSEMVDYEQRIARKTIEECGHNFEKGVCTLCREDKKEIEQT